MALTPMAFKLFNAARTQGGYHTHIKAMNGNVLLQTVLKDIQLQRCIICLDWSSGARCRKEREKRFREIKT